MVTEPGELDVLRLLASDLTQLGYPRGTSPLDTSVQPRGYRVLSHIPRVPEPVIGRVVGDFQTLDMVVRASQRDLEAVEGR